MSCIGLHVFAEYAQLKFSSNFLLNEPHSSSSHKLSEWNGTFQKCLRLYLVDFPSLKALTFAKYHWNEALVLQCLILTFGLNAERLACMHFCFLPFKKCVWLLRCYCTNEAFRGTRF